MSRRYAALLSGLLLFSALLFSVVWAQEQKPESDANAVPNMNMAGQKPSALEDRPGMEAEGGAHAMHAMENRHMDMGPHMKMTGLRHPQPGDSERAAEVVAAARKVAGKYLDYKTALADGFKIFLPDLPQKQYHFTNYRYGFEAALRFNPDHPTSLLYEKRGDGYRLIGVMYTAPKNFSEDELNERIPLSIAQWHAHVNLCVPPPDKRNEMRRPNPRFGLAGSISTADACSAAGGNFIPQIFGWMVHIYPFAPKPEDIWSLDRQAHGPMD